ncbi:MAG: serine hydrolase domain-containing protein, partial [Bacteroidota bacterium]
MKHLIRLFLIIFSSINLAFGQIDMTALEKPEQLGLSSDSLNKMDDYFHSLVDSDQLAGIQTAIIKDGAVVHFDSYGFANIEEEVPLTKHSIFRIFSMTKPIVSVALMQLYEKGLINLEDPLYKYLPEFKEVYVHRDGATTLAKNPIKIIDLLRHSSGYSYGNVDNEFLSQAYADANLYVSQTNKEFIEKLAKVPLEFEPGTNWRYGLSTNICGYLIEVLSGESLDAYLRNHIFKPLNMNDTHFQIPNSKIKNFTTGYAWNEAQGLHVVEQAHQNRYVNEVSLFNGGGGLVSTTIDYL